MFEIEQTGFKPGTGLKGDASIIKSLGHPVRLKILAILERQECNVKNIWECLEMEQCVVSQHLAVLKKSGIITGRRRGSETIYTIESPLAQRIVATLVAP